MTILKVNIPVVISFNNNYVLPAKVSISSLLESAHKTTHYKIFVLYSSDRLDNTNISDFKLLENTYENCEILFKDVGDAFQNANGIGHLTIDAYYRLLIPEILPNYDKVLYVDVDTVFQGDLSEIYSVELGQNYFGAVPIVQGGVDPNYIKDLGIDKGEYVNTGFLIFNCKKIREDQLIDSFLSLIPKRTYNFLDQDVINIVCQGRILYLDSKYNLTNTNLKKIIKDENWNLMDSIIKDAIMVHYTGQKPWNVPVLLDDIWWQFYRKCNSFYSKFYLMHQAKYITNINRAIRMDRALSGIGFYKVIKFFRHVFKK